MTRRQHSSFQADSRLRRWYRRVFPKGEAEVAQSVRPREQKQDQPIPPQSPPVPPPPTESGEAPLHGDTHLHALDTTQTLTERQSQSHDDARDGVGSAVRHVHTGSSATVRKTRSRLDHFSITPAVDSGGLIPSAVQCGLKLFYGGKFHTHHQLEWISTTDMRWFGKFEAEAENILLVQGFCKDPQDKEALLYKKAGRCRLIRKSYDQEDTEVESQVVETQRQWDAVIPVMVARHALQLEHSNRRFNDTFQLEIRWEYALLNKKRKEGESYAQTIQKTLYDNAIENWEGKRFVPRRVLDRLFTEDTIHELVEQDDSLKRPSRWDPTYSGRMIDKKKLVSEIVEKGVQLLALTVYAEIDLSCVFQLINTSKDCNKQLSIGDCPTSIKVPTFERLIQYQSLFNAHIFLNNEQYKGSRRIEHHKVDKSTVIPILFNETSDLVGEGGFSHVFKVKIHSDHHYFSSDRDSFFALKRFRARDRTEQYFEDEAKALQALAKNPHRNITLHLASWTHDGRFYMLFPFADGDGGTLKKYLLSNPSPMLTKEFVIWLLSQMRDLAAAVQHIYNSASPLNKNMPKTEPSDRTNAQLSAGLRRRPSHRGIHYDLKPENILLFSDKQNNRTFWRISDFGLAEINEIVLSGSTTQPEHTFANKGKQGDPEYSAPDEALQQKTSRKYDIWSLGCIYLEILIWVFGRGGEELREFQEERLVVSEPQANQDQKFWYLSRTGVRLKPKVVEKMKGLRLVCAERGVFKELFRLTSDMLTIKPAERPNAPTVHNDMVQILIQAEHDLLDDPDSYTKPFHSKIAVAAPPTVSRKPSRPNSIDERAVGLSPTRPDAPPRYMHIDTTHHARTKSEPTLDVATSPLLNVPNGEERFAGQWQDQDQPDPYPTRVSAHGSPRSRSPSISIHKPNGEIELMQREGDLSAEEAVA